MNSPAWRQVGPLVLAQLDGHRLQRMAGKALTRSARSSRCRPPRLATRARSRSSPRAAAPARRRRCCSHGTQAPSEPSRDQLAPPSASTSTSARTLPSPCGVSKRSRRGPAPPAPTPSPASDGACGTARPARAAGAARHAATARPSCRCGNTRPELPTKVSMPSPAAQSRNCCGAEATQQCAELGAPSRRSARRRARSPRHASGSVRPCRPAGTCARPTAWRRRGAPSAPPWPAPRRPSARPARRRPRRARLRLSSGGVWAQAPDSKAGDCQCDSRLYIASPAVGPGGRPDALTLAFHVDYWDRSACEEPLFQRPTHSQRQSQLQRSSGARTTYAPQVVADGLDRRG